MAGFVSGGEQQMRHRSSQMAKPKLMPLDEPSMGLSLLIKEIRDYSTPNREEKIPILLVEQNVKLA
jgi:ABC-type branched-subunit amino acid transport system ATPase component